MNFKKICLFAAFAAVFSSCADEALRPEDGHVTVISADIDGCGSKTAIGPKSGNLYPVLWTATDTIVANGCRSSAISLKDDGNDADFTFNASVLPPYEAFSPASALTADGFAYLPPRQKCRADGTPDPSTMILVGNGSVEGSVGFKSAVAYLKLNIGNSENSISSITLRSKGGEPLNGRFRIDYKDRSITALSTDVSGVLVCECGTDSDLPIFITIPAQEYSKGLYIDIVDSADRMMRDSTNRFTALACKVYNKSVTFKPLESGYVVLDPGATVQEKIDPKPSHPDTVRTVEYNDFYNSFQDELDEYGNIDYVCAKGSGTADPFLTSDNSIRLYQGSASKGGGYIRIRAKYDVKLLKISLGTSTKTKVAWALNGAAKKGETVSLAAGDTLYFESADNNVTEVCFWCMGTDKTERWDINYIKVEYKGGFIEEDFLTPEVEFGPLLKVKYPFTENFEDASFPTTEKNSYYKYGLTAGPENLKWSTWWGCFSWEHPSDMPEGAFGSKSPQLRVYQNDPEYDKSQFGYLRMEYFLKDLASVDFDYWFSEYWIKADVYYCDFGTTELKGCSRIQLESYSDRKTLRHFTYVLDGGNRHDAKIVICISSDTGQPGSGHYDLLFDNFEFSTN